MTGQQAFIYQKNNRLIDAAISCTIAASTKAPLVYPEAKKGTGNIKIQGDYTGETDATYEAVIADTAFTAPVVSSPTFRGAGTGKIRDILASGIDAQKIQVLCTSTGVSTQSAEVEIEGLLFRAKASGAVGNGISISIDNSTLAFAESGYSTLKDLKAGDTGLTGQEWDFDTKVILGTIIPDAAHRLSFGGDALHIYRQYKKFESNAYKYYFITPIKYEVKAGSKVFFVTGGRTITVSDGITTETYENIVTIADFWTVIKASSDLIEPVNSSIDTSKTADSPAVRELAVMTDAYFLPPYRDDKSSTYAGTLDNVTLRATAKTELIAAECTDNSTVGEEIWNVKGTSSGDLGQAKTGEFTDFGPVGFTIPQRLPDDFGQVNENWSMKAEYASRAEGVTPPPICFNMRLGINSVPQTLTLTYKKKPVECSCPVVSFSDNYLGFQEKGGEIGMAYTIEDLSFWLDAMKEIMEEKFTLNELLEGRDKGYYSVGQYYIFSNETREYFSNFRTLAKRLMALPEDNPEELASMNADFKSLVKSLRIHTYPSTHVRMDYPRYEVGAIIEAPVYDPETNTFNSYEYECAVAGFVGTESFEWPSVVNQTVVDGGVTWRCRGKCIDLCGAPSCNHGQRAVTPFFFVGDQIVAKTRVFECTVGRTLEDPIDGYIGHDEPTWPDELDETVTDGDITWKCVSLTVPGSSYEWVDGAWALPGIYYWMGTMTTSSDTSYDTDAYQALVEAILLYEKTYGLKKNSVSYGDVPYWPIDSDYYWEVSGIKAYLPAFTDNPYYSVIKLNDTYVNTKEFGLNISVPCGGSLIEGDKLIVTIGQAAFSNTYQVGDLTYLPTVAAADLNLTGGIDGDDTYRWQVKGDIDSFDDYFLDRTDPQPYSSPHLSFGMTDGIVGFQVGDLFETAIEGGHFKWRKDGGAWSEALPLSKEFQDLDEGLQIAFEFGVSPSFVIDDLWEILCIQENKASNMTVPWEQATKGSGDILISFTQQVTIDCLIIDRHNLTGSVTFQASDEEDFDELLLDEDIEVTGLVCYLPESITARYFKIIPADDYEIGHLFLGTVMRLGIDADSVIPLKRFNMSRLDGKVPFSFFNFCRKGFTLDYKSFIRNTDYELLSSMIEYLKTNNDMSLYFVPNFNYPEDCIRGRVDTDNIEPGSDIDYNAPPEARLYTLTFSIVGAA